MIKNKILILILMILPSIANATSTMFGITKKGLFDDDNVLDVLTCTKGDSTNYFCTFTFSSSNKELSIEVNNNYNSSSFIVNQIRKSKGVVIQTASWGEEQEYYYKYDHRLNNLFKYKEIHRINPVGPDDSGDYKEYNFDFMWSIDNKILKLKGCSTYSCLSGAINQKIKAKEFDNIVPLLQSVKNDTLDADALETYRQLYQTLKSQQQLEAAEAIQTLIDRSLVSSNFQPPKEVVAKFKKSNIKSVFNYPATAYLEAFPVDKKNYRYFNDIGFYLSTKMQRDQDALDIYKAVEKISPNRVVLMLNMADSYWAIDEKEKALIYYKKYVDLMTKAGKEARIPAKVFERLEHVK